jgi:hypothetical protein
MNATTVALDMNASLREQLAFLAVPAKRSSEQVSTTTEQLVKAVFVMVNQIVGDAIVTRTAEEFCAVFSTGFPQYAKIMVALGSLISTSVDKSVIERLTYESLSELEGEFRDEGQFFGEDIKEQAIFTVWQLRKINDLVQQCSDSKPTPDQAKADREFSKNYLTSVFHARFSLDCLRMALKSNRPIFPGPLDMISDGLRAAVDAYAWVRQARDLRHPFDEDEAVEIPWDAEQQELLQSSMQEMLREAY